MDAKKFREQLKEIFANSPVKNASEETMNKFIDGLIDNYYKLYTSNLEARLSDEQLNELNQLESTEEINKHLESLGVDYEDIAAESAFQIMEIANKKFTEAAQFIDEKGNNQA